MFFTGSYKYNFTSENSTEKQKLFDESGLTKSASVNGIRDTNEGKTSIFNAKELRAKGEKYLKQRGEELKSAKLDPKDKKELKDYNKQLYPEDYAEDMVADCDDKKDKKKDTKNMKNDSKKKAMKISQRDYTDSLFESRNDLGDDYVDDPGMGFFEDMSEKEPDDLKRDYLKGDLDLNDFIDRLEEWFESKESLNSFVESAVHEKMNNNSFDGIENDEDYGYEDRHLGSSNKKRIASKEEDPCWDGYEMVGKKNKDGKEVPNCVKKKSFNLSSLSKKKNPYYKGK